MIAEATKTAVAVLVAGKFETLGSNFSHEIRFCEAAGADAIHNNFFVFLFYDTNKKCMILNR